MLCSLSSLLFSSRVKSISSLQYRMCKLELPLKLTEAVREYLRTEYELVWPSIFLVYHSSFSLVFSCRQLQLRASSCYLDMDLLQKLLEPQLPNMIVFQCNSEKDSLVNYKLQGKLIKIQYPELRRYCNHSCHGANSFFELQVCGTKI